MFNDGFILIIIYIIAAVLTNIVLVFLLTKSKKEKDELVIAKDNLAQRIAFLQNQLELIHNKNANEGRLSSTDDIIDSLEAAVILLDRENMILTMNNTAERICGHTRLSAFHQSIDQIFKFSPEMEILKRPEAENPTVIISGQRLTDATGAEIQVAGYLSRFKSQQIPFQILYFENVTAKNQQLLNLNEKIKSLQEYYNKTLNQNILGQFIYETINSPILILNPNQTIQELNGQAELLIGQKNENVRNKSIKDFFYLCDQKDLDITDTILKEAKSKRYEIPQWIFIKTISRKIPVSGFISYDARHERYIFMASDVSREFDKIQEDQTVFSGIIHDLRTPLTTARGVLDLISDTKLNLPPEKIHELVSGAQQSIIYMITLVNDLLNISRLEQNRVSINKESFDLYQLTQEIIQNYLPQAQSRGIFIQHDSGGYFPKVYADKTKTNEIINNLISNAVKYTLTGGVTVSHTLKDIHLLTCVKDTGGGIAESYRPLLFKKFQQIGNARKLTTAKSSGMGLYISKKYAGLMNGDVYLNSTEVGRGSEFCLSLPISGEN